MAQGGCKQLPRSLPPTLLTSERESLILPKSFSLEIRSWVQPDKHY